MKKPTHSFQFLLDSEENIRMSLVNSGILEVFEAELEHWSCRQELHGAVCDLDKVKTLFKDKGASVQLQQGAQQKI